MTKIAAAIVVILGIGIFFTSNADKEEPIKLDNANDDIAVDNSIDIGDEDFYDNREYQNVEIYIDNLEILILESFPLQTHAVVSGQIPDNCRDGIFAKANYNPETKTFDIDLRAKPLLAPCMPLPVYFEENIALDVYGLAKGTYKVETNNIVKEFTLSTDNILR